MEQNNKVARNGDNLTERFGEEINRAYERAVREALKRHKLLGNPVAISRNGKVVLVQPDEIIIEDE
jgi:hypothetical protein